MEKEAESGGNPEEQDEEDLERREEEWRAAEQFKEEAEAKSAAKVENRRANLSPGDLRLSESSLRSLDGSVKKNTAFQRKLRTLTEQQRTALTADLKALNLSKYLQEVACSIAEAKLKLADVGCAIHLCTLLHQRYGEFSEMLLDKLQQIYQTPISKEEEKSAVTSKYRLGLRLIGELILAGIVVQDVGVSLLLDMFLALVTADERGHPYLSVVVSFARHFAEDLAGIWPRKQRTLMDKFNMKMPEAKLLPASNLVEFSRLFHSYFASASLHLVREHKAMHKRERRNHQLLTTKGEILEERQAENEAAQKAYDKLLTSMSTLAELLNEDMPDLPEYQAPQEDSDISIELQFPSLGESDEADPAALWEDEDTRQFYEGITDIKPFVPAIVLEERKKSASESTDDEAGGDLEARASEEEMDEEQVLEQMIRDAEEDPSLAEPDEEEEEEGDGLSSEDHQGEEVGVSEPGTPAALFEQFVVRLPNMMNRKLVDDMAVEFCMTLNTKLHRKKLAKALHNVERNRMDLIPFYSRLVATLSPCVNDVDAALLEVLLGDLRYQIRKKDQLRIHTKLKNIRFLAELTKFGICPKPEAMKCITHLLRDFTHHHIDMACLFLEHCGRFLLRSPDSHLRAKALLEILIRKKKVQHLDSRQKSLIENALYYANPPQISQLTVVVEPPVQRYVKKLLYKDLNRLNTEKILRQIRKLDWRDPEVFGMAVSCLAGIWNIKYNNIHCMANLLAGLKGYQEEVVIRVVDAVLEDIRLGLELNIPKLNQRRVSSIKFVGEMYTYQLLESNVVFRTLYLLLQFGANPDGSPSPLDPFDSYFRVRLVCILLDTCGQYFDRGSSKKRLDSFLVYFQCYLFSKRQPQPLEVEYLVRDTIESLRPQLELFKTAQEAYEAALELEKKYKDKIGSDERGVAGEESDEEEESRQSGPQKGEEEEEEEEEGEEEVEEEEVEGETMAMSFEEDPVLKTAPALVKCQEDDEFVANFEKMMSEDFLSRKSENWRVPNLDVAVPMHLKGPKGAPKATLISEGGEVKMKFKLMTRKGHKQQLKELSIPLDSDLTSGLKDTQQAKAEEDFEEIKQKILESERRQEEEDYQAMITAIQEENQVKVLTSKKQGGSSRRPHYHQQHSPTFATHHPQHQGGAEGGGGQPHGPGTGRGGGQNSAGYQGQGQGRGGSQNSQGQGQGRGQSRGGGGQSHGCQGRGGGYRNSPRGRGGGAGGGAGGGGSGSGGNRQRQNH